MELPLVAWVHHRERAVFESCLRIYSAWAPSKGSPRAIPGGTSPMVGLGRSEATDRTSFVENLLENHQTTGFPELPRGSTWL